MLRRCVLSVLIVGHAMVSGARPGVAQTRTLQVDDLFAIGRVGDPRVSPDGEWVAFTVSRTSLADEESETRIWMTSLATGETLAMTASGSSADDPRWSPDGRWLSFTAARNGGKTQVWRLDRRGGEAQPLTDVGPGVAAYEWSPDGARLLLTIRDADEDADSAEAVTKPPWVIDRLQFKRDGVKYLTGDRHTHLFVFDVASKQLTQLTDGRWDESQGTWSPDGRRVAFVSNRTEDPDANSNSDIWVVDTDAVLAAGAPAGVENGPALTRVTTNDGSDSQPAWSPDGQSIAHVSVVEPDLIWYAMRHLAVSQADGSGTRIVTAALDRRVGSPRFSEDGRSVYVELEDSAEDHLARIEIAGGTIERVVRGPVSVAAFDWSVSGTTVALVSTIDRPAEVYRVGQDGELAPITAINDSIFGVLELATVHNVTFPSGDGTAIEGFVYLPPNHAPGVRHPTLLRIHGGPVSQFSHTFNFEAQLFAAHGYAVVTVNPRGSSGYGQAFSHAIWADWGNRDFHDVMAGVDYAIEQGWADPDRLGVGGWSYGGILTNYVITKSDRFAAAITGASEVLYIANYGHDHYQLQWEKELGLPWEHRENWERISPFNAVDEVVTPTLVMGGEDDWNVPIQNSEQLYQALRRRGVPTQLVVYPGQSHGLRIPSYQKDRLERYLAWYDRWVKQAATQSTSGR